MNLRSLLSTTALSLALAFSISGCDDGGDGEEAADTNPEAEAGTEAETEEGTEDIDCATFCTAFIDMCLQTGDSTEFETNDACTAACGAWDQAGTNCRYEQITSDACDQAGNTGTAC